MAVKQQGFSGIGALDQGDDIVPVRRDGLNSRAKLQLIEAMSNKFCYFVFSWAARASYYRL